MLGLIHGAQIQNYSRSCPICVYASYCNNKTKRDFIRWGACTRSRAIVIVPPDRMRDRLQAILHSYPSMNLLGIVLYTARRGRVPIFALKIIGATVTNIYRRDFTCCEIPKNGSFDGRNNSNMCHYVLSLFKDESRRVLPKR